MNKLNSSAILYRNTQLSIYNNYVIEDIWHYLDETIPQADIIEFELIDYSPYALQNWKLEFVFKHDDWQFNELTQYKYLAIRDYEYEFNSKDGDPLTDEEREIRKKGLKDIRYYFVTDYERVVTNKKTDKKTGKQYHESVFVLYCHPDVLNTYFNKLTFSPLTHITRKHIDRFNYGENNSCINKTDTHLYLLRNIPPIKENLNCNIIPSHNYSLYAHNTSLGTVLQGDLWVKIFLSEINKDSYEQNGWVMFIPYRKEVNIKAYNGSGYVESYYNLATGSDDNKLIAKAITLDTAHIQHVSLSPYAPTTLLRNAFYNEKQTDISSDKRFSLRTIALTSPIGSGTVNLTGIIINPIDFMPKDEKDTEHPNGRGFYNPVCSAIDFITIPKSEDDKKNQEILLNKLFGDFLICKNTIDDVNKMIVNIHNKVAQDFFGESSLFASRFLEILLCYEKISINLGLETLFYDTNKDFKKLCEVYDFDPETATVAYPDKTFLSISCTPYSSLDAGLNIDVTNGDYFYLYKDIHTASHADLNFIRYTSEWLNYMTLHYNADKKAIEDKYNEEWWRGIETAGFGMANMAVGAAQLSFTNKPINAVIETTLHSKKLDDGGFFSKVERSVKGGSNSNFMRYGAVGRIIGGAESLIRGIIQSSVWADMHYRNNMSQFDSRLAGLMNQGTQTNFTNSFLDNYFTKAYLNVNRLTAEDNKSLSIYFKRFGNVVNEYGVPTYHNRIFYDYLVCDDVKLLKNNINNEMIEEIKMRLNIGVTFIHKFEYWVEPSEGGDKQLQHMYCFPDEGLENLEVTLYNYLTDYGKK